MKEKAIPGWRKKEDKNGGNITGGSYSESLSNENLDNSLGGLIHIHALDARAFYDFRTELDPAERKKKRSKLREVIAESLEEYHHATLPAHVRFHWATSFIKGSNLKEAVAYVVDPAPSSATQSDLKKAFRDLGIPLKRIYSIAMQPKGTNQCGLHVIATALIADVILSQGLRLTWSSKKHKQPEVIDLDPWRPLLAASGNKQVQWTPDFKEKMLAAVPQVRQLLYKYGYKDPEIQAGAPQEQIMETRHKKFCPKCSKS